VATVIMVSAMRIVRIQGGRDFRNGRLDHPIANMSAEVRFGCGTLEHTISVAGTDDIMKATWWVLDQVSADNSSSARLI
jgi:hypothetical protein